MRLRTFAWLLMSLLSLAVAGYATTVVFVPDARPPLIQTLLQHHAVAAYAHFMGGAIALAAGAFQLNAWLRGRFIAAHRWLGRLYVVAILAGGAAGFRLALSSTAGPIAQAGFALLAVCWLVCTVNAYRHIRQGHLAAHRDWMIRSYAVTWSAVTLRIYIPVSLLAQVPMEMAYPAISWLCWVPNLFVAEALIRWRAAGSGSREAPRVNPSGAA